MTVYGYVRVSTVKQKIERQIRSIKKLNPNAIIIADEWTGTKMNRPGWEKLMRAAKAGDTIIFDEVSRMSRNAEDGFNAYTELYDRGVNLIFIKEPHINTEVFKKTVEKRIESSVATGRESTDKLVSAIIEAINAFCLDLLKEQIRIAFERAQEEIDYLHQRTREGIAVARLEGKQIGQAEGKKLTTKKSIKAKEEILKYSKDFNGTLEDKDVMKLTGLARNTYYKYKRELKAEA